MQEAAKRRAAPDPGSSFAEGRRSDIRRGDSGAAGSRPEPDQEKELMMANTLIRWPGWGDYPELRHRLDQFFDEFSGGATPTKLAKLDVLEDKGKLLLRAEMPGIKPDDVKIEVADDVLTVHGEHEESKESQSGKTKDADKRFLRRERSYASFTRSVALPPKVDASKIEASVHDGLVEITVPLPEEGADKVVQITPKAAA